MRRSGWALCALFALVVTGCLDKSHYDSASQMAQDVQTIDDYLTSNNITAVRDQSGVRSVITQIGTGFPPRVAQTVKVKYKGKFMNGTVFDPGPDITAPLGSFILGWQYGLSTWPAGTKGTLYVPSPLAYGNSSPSSSIPPNSILVFDAELVSVVLSNADQARVVSDSTTIANYLAEKKINAVQDTTGIAYVITDPGTGPAPTWFQKLKFNYTGKAMATGNQFFTGSTQPSGTFDSRMVDFIPGIQLGLGKIGKGGKITVYIPSVYAFGSAENPSINLPANSIVIYDIELTDIVE